MTLLRRGNQMLARANEGFVGEIERLRAMLDKIAKHPDVPELIRQYAAGRLFSPETGDWRLETGGQPDRNG